MLTGYLKNICKSSVLAALILTLMLAVTACSDEKTTEVKKDEPEYETVAHLNFPINNIKTLNPTVSKDEDTYFISRLIYDGMYEMSDGMIPVPNLAESAKFTKGGHSVTVNLKEAKFHDGKSFNADDVKFSIDAYKAAGSDCPYYSLIKNINYAETKGKRKIKIFFHNKTSRSLAMLTFPILPKHRYDGPYSVIYKTDSFRPVGTGRYKYKSFKNQKTLKLSAFKDYHGEPAENSLSFIVSDAGSAYQLVEAASLSALVTTQTDREARVGQKEQKIISFPANEVEYIGFNFNREQTKKKNIRKAIAYAIDTNALIEETYTNSGISNDSLFYSGYMGTENKGDQYQYNPSEAARLLNKEGYKKRDGGSQVTNKYGSTLSLTMLVNSDSRMRSALADRIEEMLEDVGINVYKTKYEKKAYKNTLKGGNFDIYIGALRFDETMDLRDILDGEKQPVKQNRQLNSQIQTNNQQSTVEDEDLDIDEDEDDSSDSSTDDSAKKEEEKDKNLARKPDNSNFIRYYNGKLNDLLDKLQSGITTETAKKTCEKAKKILNDDLPYYCLLQRTYGAVQSLSMEGEMSPLFDNIYRGIGGLKSKFEVTEKEDEENTGN